MRRLALLLCLLPTLAVADASLGRLFLSPAERAALQAARERPQPQPMRATPPANKKRATMPPLTMQGYVKRSDGKSTLWINGKPLQEQESAPAFEVGDLHDGRVSVSAPGAKRAIRLQAGQRYDPASGRVVDGLDP